MNSILLVQETRAGIGECEHSGHICCVDYTGNLVYASGNPDYVAYLRSSGKPIQALPALMSGVERRFGLTREEMAVMIGSHRAEEFHIRVLESMMSKIGVTEEALVCKPTYPLGRSSYESVIRNGEPARAIYHNCSGKHLGIIAYCKLKGYPIEGYWEFSHPVQQEILRLIAELSECSVDKLVMGIDGCGLPVYALPLRNIALMYLKLASPELIAGTELQQTLRDAASLMEQYPRMIAGTERICSELLLDSNIVAKGGAKGIYCFALKREKLAFAFKVLDGSEEEWPLIVASILEQIGYANKATIERMHRLCPQQILNDNGVPVGERKAVFVLEKTSAIA